MKSFGHGYAAAGQAHPFADPLGKAAVKTGRPTVGRVAWSGNHATTGGGPMRLRHRLQGMVVSGFANRRGL
jgi:hypothetical protein